MIHLPLHILVFYQMCRFGRLLFQKNKGIYCVSRLIFDDAAYTVIRHQGTYTHIHMYRTPRLLWGWGWGVHQGTRGGGGKGGPRKGGWLALYRVRRSIVDCFLQTRRRRCWGLWDERLAKSARQRPKLWWKYSGRDEQIRCRRGDRLTPRHHSELYAEC
jgi:hypothetical protein